jgi:ribosomal protein S18 acetylase RimI-like enzyme
MSTPEHAATGAADKPIIREMEPHDREAVIDLIWELNRFEDRISNDRAPGRKAAAAGLANNRRRMGDLGGVELVAALDGRIVAYLLCVIEAAQPYVRDAFARHAYIAELVVTEAARGRRIGQALIAEAESYARARDMSSILISALAGNAAADGLYEHLGYRAYTIERIKRLV